MRHPPLNRLPNRWLCCAAFIIVVGIGAGFYLAKAGEGDGRSAIVRWRPYLMDLMNGAEIYREHAHPNSPIMAMVLLPFAYVPRLQLAGWSFDFGALAWFLAKAVMALAALAMTCRVAALRGVKMPWWAMAIALALAGRPILGDLMHGNVNLWILFLITASLYAYAQRWDFSAGLGIGLAAACKVTPALFLVYFLWKRSWRSLAGFVIGIPLFAWLVPALFFGPSRAGELLASWADQMIVPYAIRGEVTSKHSNQSIPGLVARLLTDNPSFYDYYDEEETDFHNVAELPPAAARRITQALGVTFLILMAWSCRTPPSQRGGWRLLAECSIIVLGMLLFSERTWKHHAVTLLLPFTVACYALAVLPLSQRQRLGFVALLLGVSLLMASTSTSLWQPFGFRQGAKLAQVYGAYVWAYLLLIGAMVWLLRSLNNESLADAAVPPSTRVLTRLTRSDRFPASAAPVVR